MVYFASFSLFCLFFLLLLPLMANKVVCVIRDSNSDFSINLDPDVRRIRSKIVDALSCRRQSFRQIWYTSAVDCMKIEKTDKC